MLGMSKREKREGESRYVSVYLNKLLTLIYFQPNPLYQLISLLCFCAWMSLLAPLPFSVKLRIFKNTSLGIKFNFEIFINFEKEKYFY